MNRHVVYRVDKVTAEPAKTTPPNLVVEAHGTVTTKAWSDAQLTPYAYVMPPSDGHYDFTLTAEAPGAGKGVNDVLQPVSATFTLQNCPPWVKGVRVHASSNNKQANV